MSLKKNLEKILIGLLKTGLLFMGKRRDQIASILAEELIPTLFKNTNRGTIQFYCPSRMSVFRANSLLTKEPETLEWINSFTENSTFWDIGANVGTYSLYASLKRNIKVLAFEPAAPNFWVLNRNIEINQKQNNILAFCIAFNDVTRLDYFFMRTTEIGSALHSFHQPKDWQGKPFSSKFKQGILGFTIDEFIEKFDPDFPNHIKIDVDGIENKIIEGGSKTIADPRLKSILIELDDNQPENTRLATSSIEKAGLLLAKKQHATIFKNSKFSSIYNHIFVRT